MKLRLGTVLSSRPIYNFGHISKFKKRHYSQKKNWIRISCGYAHLHIKSFITTKFQEILLSGFRGDLLTTCFSSIFYFGQISKFKKGVTPRERKREDDLSYWTCVQSQLLYVAIKICSNQIRKKLNQNFQWICPLTHYVLHNYKVSPYSVERFQRSCADKKNRTDGLTKTLYPPQFVAWGVIILPLHTVKSKILIKCSYGH